MKGGRKATFKNRRRKKSIEDIRRQYDRIQNLARFANSNYYNRVYGYNGALGIAQRYIDNITRQRDYKNDVRNLSQAYSRGDYPAAKMYSGQADSRQYTRRQYMGLSNG